MNSYVECNAIPGWYIKPSDTIDKFGFEIWNGQHGADRRRSGIRSAARLTMDEAIPLLKDWVDNP